MIFVITPFGIFLSTPSARRATAFYNNKGQLNNDFYPRPPRGGRHVSDVTLGPFVLFLSTPSARRATSSTTPIWTLTRSFLSTPSARRATFNAPKENERE